MLVPIGTSTLHSMLSRPMTSDGVIACTAGFSHLPGIETLTIVLTATFHKALQSNPCKKQTVFIICDLRLCFAD